MVTTDTLCAQALHYATRGWRVFPITPRAKKPPLHTQWETRASTNREQIQIWWRRLPFSIGIATGPSGLVVIDLDTPKPGEPVPEKWATQGITTGAEALQTLAEHHGTTVTPTYAVRTPSGGWHLYYTTPTGAALRSTQGMIGWKIDTRAHGGYALAPPSPVPPHGYQLTDDRDPVPLPTWLHQALTPKPPQAPSALPVTAPTNPDRYVAAVLHGECRQVRTAPPGRHNAVLCRAAYRIGQRVAAGLLDEVTARAELTIAAQTLINADCDCTPREVARVIAASLAAGARNPRHVFSPPHPPVTVLKGAR